MTLSNEGGLDRGEESSEVEDRFLWGFNGDFLIIVSGADLTTSLKKRERKKLQIVAGFEGTGTGLVSLSKIYINRKLIIEHRQHSTDSSTVINIRLETDQKKILFLFLYYFSWYLREFPNMQVFSFVTVSTKHLKYSAYATKEIKLSYI